MKITKQIKHAITVVTIVLMTGFTLTAQAQVQRASHQQVKFMIERIEKGTDNFRLSLKDALDQSRLNSTTREENINQYVTDFENAADQLKGKFSDDNTAVKAVEEVLQRAGVIDAFVRTHRLTPHAQADWEYLRANLNGLNWFGVSKTPYRASQKYLEDLLARIEDKGDRFRKSVEKGLEQTRFDGTRAEDNINHFIADFEARTDRLQNQFNDQHAAVGTVSEMLRRAARIDNFMRRHRLSQAAQDDWQSLRQDLDSLARAYDVSVNWRSEIIILRRIG
jgi:hypothetical protein